MNKNKVIDVSQGDNKNSLISYDFHGGKNQKFKFIQSNNGGYFI